MDPVYLFFNMTGRINRERWWAGMVVLSFVWVALVFALLKTFDIDIMTAWLTVEGQLANIVALVVVAYPATALMVKRLNDRDRPHWLVLIYWLPIVIGIKLHLLGLMLTRQEVGGLQVPTFTPLGWVVYVVALALFLELGLLRGTRGANRHGPDPLTIG